MLHAPQIARKLLAQAALVLAGVIVLAGAPVRAASGFLPPEVAFALHASMSGPRTLAYRFRLAPGYHLYRERFRATVTDAQGRRQIAPLTSDNVGGVRQPALRLPAARRVQDRALGQEMAVYEGHLLAELLLPAGEGSLAVLLEYQGCATAGLCYAPEKAQVQLTSDGRGGYTVSDGLVMPAPAAASSLGSDQRGREVAPLRFQPISSLADLSRELRVAQAPVLLFVTADWCAACRKQTEAFKAASVHTRLATMRLLQVDLTQTTPAHRALLARFGLVGMPALVFFNREGDLVAPARLVGPATPKDLLHSLEQGLPGWDAP